MTQHRLPERPRRRLSTSALSPIVCLSRAHWNALSNVETLPCLTAARFRAAPPHDQKLRDLLTIHTMAANFRLAGRFACLRFVCPCGQQCFRGCLDVVRCFVLLALGGLSLTAGWCEPCLGHSLRNTQDTGESLRPCACAAADPVPCGLLRRVLSMVVSI